MDNEARPEDLEAKYCWTISPGDTNLERTPKTFRKIVKYMRICDTMKLVLHHLKNGSDRDN